MGRVSTGAQRESPFVSEHLLSAPTVPLAVLAARRASLRSPDLLSLLGAHASVAGTPMDLGQDSPSFSLLP